MKNKIILTVAVLTLIACGKKDSDKKGDKKSGTSQELVSKPELTQAQKDEIKEIITKSNVIPRTDLLTDDTSKSAELKAAVDEKVKALPTDEKQVYEKLKADCQIGKSERKESGDLKAKNSKQELKWTASISGDKCPISFKADSSNESTVSDGTSGEEGTVKSTTKTEEKTSVKMQDLQNQSGMKEMSISQNGNGTVVIKDGKPLAITAKDIVTMKMVTIKDQTIKAEMTMELNDSKDNFEGYIRVDFEFPSSKPTLQAFRKKGDTETAYYLNGEKISVEKLAEIFTAKSIPVIGETNKPNLSQIRRRLM